MRDYFSHAHTHIGHTLAWSSGVGCPIKKGEILRVSLGGSEKEPVVFFWTKGGGPFLDRVFLDSALGCSCGKGLRG